VEPDGVARAGAVADAAGGPDGVLVPPIDALHREGRVGRNGMPGPLAYGVFLTEYRDVFRLAAPDLLTRPVLGILGAIGRLRGYRARI
jgi:hypothetical protein